MESNEGTGFSGPSVGRKFCVLIELDLAGLSEKAGFLCLNIGICTASLLSSLNWWGAGEGACVAAQEAPSLQNPHRGPRG